MYNNHITSSGITIGFDEIQYNVDEPTGQITITVSVQAGNLQRPAEVTFLTTDGTATSIGAVDFVALDSVVLQFDENTLTIPIVITIVDDSILEDLEFFFGNLTTSDEAVDLLPDTTTINIQEIGDGKLPMVSYCHEAMKLVIETISGIKQLL